MNKNRIKSYLETTFDVLVIIDLILIINSLPIPGLHLLEYSGFVRYFDLTICFLLLAEFFYGLYKSDSKIKFTKEHILDLIASIPFDLLPIPSIVNLARFLRLIRIFRIFRAVNIVRKYDLEKLIKRTGIDKILIIVAVIVVIFSCLLFFTDTHNLTDSFYFVIITLTTVGYSDDMITTPIGKFISIFLIIIGVLVFSTITGIMSSYFTDRVLEEGISIDENLHFINQKLNFHERAMEKSNKELEEVKEELSQIKEELEKSNKYSEDLKRKLNELKELIKEK